MLIILYLFTSRKLKQIVDFHVQEDMVENHVLKLPTKPYKVVLKLFPSLAMA